ncbi:unnamed protein product [Heligmosomoides polygyrus]|uniref:Uncharacterized protein n=1 Tax=Heligmosomoides polygyrus TaxID=6339 RepID=A0A183GFE3_HELPZ|nr:unnamed protein product [Heligmosomoides polygyrus]
MNVCNILDFLNVDCSPVTVYRLGKKILPNRPLKVVLPARVFQRAAVSRSCRLRFFSEHRVFLRESLSQEELKRRREERNATRADDSRASPGSPIRDSPGRSSTPALVANALSNAQVN